MATLRREWEAKREATSTSAGASGAFLISADDSATTGSPGSQHRQSNNDEDDTDIDVEDDSTMDKNICHDPENRCQENVHVTSDEETNYNNINYISTTMKTNTDDGLVSQQGYDAVTSYSDDSKRMSQELTQSVDTISPPCRTPRPSAAKRSNPFSIESLLSHAEEYTD
jgi:hypothetical protein